MFSDTPLLKPTLDAHREDKDGAVFYRLADPTTGREYRLYEVEYLIAQMLDGRTPIGDIAARVRDELKFDLSANDLERFVRELESLGFLSGTGKPVAKVSEQPSGLSADDIMQDAEVAEVDKMAVTDELERLVRSALLHVKQGMVTQARDYFLAAKKFAPADDKVGTMLNHLEVVGEDDGPSDIEYLWKQAVVLYPGLTQEIGPPGIGAAPIPPEEQRDGGRTRTRRLTYALGLAGFLALGFVAWELVGRDLLRPPLPVETDKVRVQRVHLFYDAQAAEVAPRRSETYAFEKNGVLAEMLVKVGAHVSEGQIIARQKLSPADEKSFAQLSQKRQAAERAFLGQSLEVDKLNGQIAAKEQEADKLKDQADDLQKELASKPPNERAAQKRDIAALRKREAGLRKDAAAIKKRAAGPQKALAKLKSTFDQARNAEQALVQKSQGAFLRATAEGNVAEISAEVGKKIEASQPVLIVADKSALRIVFKGADRRLQALEQDTKIMLLHGDGDLAEGHISERTGDGAVIEVPDADGAIAEVDKKSLKVVRETLENALVVPAGAHVSASHAYVVEDGIAKRRPVEWVEVRDNEAIARSGLSQGEVVVIGPDNATAQLKTEHVEVELSARGLETAQ